jgi:ligand-binding SRPBCC domain-containing protein
MLDAPREAVWRHAGTMAGVNYELMPLVDMSVPREAARLRLEDAPTGEVAFYSWLRLGGVLPFDRHALQLVEVDPPRGFVEESSSWLQRRWRHERTLEDHGRRCLIVDRVLFEPRVELLGSWVHGIVSLIFVHRHRRLRRRFGGDDGPGRSVHRRSGV